MKNLRDRLGRLKVDITPLRTSRDFRLLFLAGTVFYLGGMVSYVAIPYQLYDLTGSNFAVGAVGLVELVPLIVFGLYGGALADHIDRRTLLVRTGRRAGGAHRRPRRQRVPAGPAGLAHLRRRRASSPPRSRCSARRARRCIPRTVAHDQLPAAVALSTLGMQVGMLAGPAVGGVLLHAVGAGWCFARRRRRPRDRDRAVRS